MEDEYEIFTDEEIDVLMEIDDEEEDGIQKMTPQEGIALMKKRIKILNKGVKRAIARTTEHPEDIDGLTRGNAWMRGLIKTCEARLREYQLQLKGQN
ncbi:MAG: hypothetical protein M1608_09400 [Candidatus Omnitrophica bacterium]|nr:hypothetical protein [Candidatus Omnitrophota bacterium]